MSLIKNNKTLQLLTILMISMSIFFISHNYDINQIDNQFNQIRINNHQINFGISAYNETGAISIFSNSALASYAVSGNGTKLNPYILENYNITANVDNILYISGTTAYTIIRNNIFDNIDGSSSTETIYLYNSQHITIVNNSLRNAETGIYSSLGIDNEFVNINSISGALVNFVENQNSLISGLNVTENGDRGIYLQYCNTTTVQNSILTQTAHAIETTYSAAFPTYGYNNVIFNNTIYNTSSSAIFDSSKYLTISNNTIYGLNDYYTAIEFFGAFNPIIENNTIMDAQNAVDLSYNVDNTYARFNTIISCDYGFYAYGLSNSADNGRFYNNTIVNTTQYAFDFETTSSSYIHTNNSFYYNYLFNNWNAFYFLNVQGVNVTLNNIVNSTGAGIVLSSITDNIWITNNSILHSKGYGLSATGTTTTGSKIRYNDFYDNKGTTHQVYDNIGYDIEQNYYFDHTNIDSNQDGFADSPYSLDGGSFTDSQPLVKPNVPYTNIDFDAPIVTSYQNGNVSMEYGSTGNTLIWLATDQNPAYYQITNNSANVFSTNQVFTSGENVTLNIDGLSLGTHTFVITFTDSFGGSNSSTVKVTVADTIAPVFTENLVSTSKAYGSANITWTAVDLNPLVYFVFIDDVMVVSGQSWSSGIQNAINISILPIGDHNVTLRVYDSAPTYIQTQIILSIVDMQSPIPLITPSDTIQFLENETTYFANFTILDDGLYGNYQIWIENVQFGSNQTWTNNTNIGINLANLGLNKGNYNVTFVFYDSSSNYYVKMINVTVGDLTTPVLTSTPSSSINHELGTSGTIQISASDDNPTRFEIYIDQSLYLNTTWVSSEVKSFDIPSSLALGNHNVTFIFVDISQNSVNYTVSINVIDSTAPKLVSFTGTDTIVEGSTGNELIWQYTDADAYNYTITMNDTIIVTNKPWTSGENIILNIDGLNKGVYVFKIIISDKSNNSNMDTITITITGNSSSTTTTTMTPGSTDVTSGNTSSTPSTQDNSSNSNTNDSQTTDFNTLFMLLAIFSLLARRKSRIMKK